MEGSKKYVHVYITYLAYTRATEKNCHFIWVIVSRDQHYYIAFSLRVRAVITVSYVCTLCCAVLDTRFVFSFFTSSCTVINPFLSRFSLPNIPDYLLVDRQKYSLV